MKLYELRAVAEHLSHFDFIRNAKRVDDNTIELIFDKENSYFFNMTRGHSFIYKTKSQRPLKSYQAPFDNLLHSLVGNSKILTIETQGYDRILRFTLAPKSSYKDKKIALQFEFTGKNTNAILIDEGETIIEALRHVDAERSFRIIRPGAALLPLPPYERKEEQRSIDNIDTLLRENWGKFESKRIEGLKKQKLSTVKKKIDKLAGLLDKLPDENELKEEEKKYRNYGNIVLANLYQIKPYDTKLKTYDFDGQEVTITLPKGLVTNRISEHFFNLAKRARNKAKNIHIEKENLSSKMAFYQNIHYAVENAEDAYELELLVPRRGKSQRKKEKLKECEFFWIEDYKVLVGRNSSENQKLLKIAKSNDLWMHIRDVPSSHVIIKTDKQNLPQNVIEAAAKLCVDFSVKNPGEYDVDYTKRKFVKIQEGSNVLYNKYDTLRVRKEGVEIRE
ncbi:MAG: NFACT RNA binding domain-containing protein [Campylobacterota bacterium]|nr:NFACT RNA binding domain-containing protein [Campylobacterota bacterium]